MTSDSREYKKPKLPSTSCCFALKGGGFPEIFQSMLLCGLIPISLAVVCMNGFCNDKSDHETFCGRLEGEMRMRQFYDSLTVEGFTSKQPRPRMLIVDYNLSITLTRDKRLLFYRGAGRQTGRGSFTIVENERLREKLSINQPTVCGGLMYDKNFCEGIFSHTTFSSLHFLVEKYIGAASEYIKIIRVSISSGVVNNLSFPRTRVMI